MSNSIRVSPKAKKEIKVDSNVDEIVLKENAFLTIKGGLEDLDRIFVGEGALLKIVGDIRNVREIILNEHASISLNGYGEKVDKLELDYFSHIDIRKNLNVDFLRVGEKARVRAYKDIKFNNKEIHSNGRLEPNFP